MSGTLMLKQVPTSSRLVSVEALIDSLDEAMGRDARHVIRRAAEAGRGYFDTMTHVEAFRMRFFDLREEWVRSIARSSSTSHDLQHPAFKHIVTLGKAAIPLLLDDMSRHRTHWFEALEAISGAQPVPEDHFGDIDAMIGDWTEWARNQGWD